MTSRPLLSVIVPTIGRDTLARTLASIQAPVGNAVEIIVIADTHGPIPPGTRALVESRPARYIELDAGGHDWGHAQTNFGMALAEGCWLMRCDDDDVYLPGAFEAIGVAIAGLSRPRPLLFRFRTPEGRMVWSEPGHLAPGHIGTPCSVFPNLPGRLGRYSSRYEGDFDFILSTLARWPNGMADARWIDETIVQARPM